MPGKMSWIELFAGDNSYGNREKFFKPDIRHEYGNKENNISNRHDQAQNSR